VGFVWIALRREELNTRRIGINRIINKMTLRLIKELENVY